MTDTFEVQAAFAPADTLDTLPDTDPAPNGFVQLGLAPELIRAVQDLGYTQPTPVQAQAIPLAMDNSAQGELSLIHI